MAFCANCDKETPAGALHCPNCGAALGASEASAVKGAGKLFKGVAGKALQTTKDVGGKAIAVSRPVANKAADVTRDVGGKAIDVSKPVAHKALDVTKDVGGKALDVTKDAARKAKDKIA